MQRLLQQDPPENAPAAPRVSVQFKSLFVLSCVFAVVVASLALLLLRNHFPVNIAVAGGALSWPLGIAVAWLGQFRQRRELSGADSSSN